MRRCIHTEDTAFVETGVCADIDPVANLGRGGRGGCPQCSMPGFHRNTICIRRIAPEVAALAGEIQVFTISHDSGTNVASIRRQINCTTGCSKCGFFSVVKLAYVVRFVCIAAKINIVAFLDRTSPIESSGARIDSPHYLCFHVVLIVRATSAARPGAKVEVIAVLDNRSVDLTGNASFQGRHSRHSLAQVRNGKDLAARAGQPLAAFIVVILADNADVENAGTFVQIRRGELESALCIQGCVFCAISRGTPDLNPVRAVVLDDLCAVGASAIEQNVGVGLIADCLHDRDVVNAVPTACASGQANFGFRRFGCRRGVYFGIVIVAAAIDVPCCKCRYAEQHGERQKDC